MSTKNLKQQQQQLQYAAMGMAAPPCPIGTKLLLCLALGFAIGVVATMSCSYTTPAVLRAGGALGLFFPPSVAVNHQPAAGVVRQQVRRPPPRPQEAPIQRSPSEPPPPSPPPQKRPVEGRRPTTRSRSQPQARDTGISAAATPRPPPPPPPPRSAGRRGSRGGGAISDDDALLSLAAWAPRERPAGVAPKVAFLFLTRWDLPMAPLWDKFFEGHRALYNVYVHTDPAFNGTDPPEGSAFYRRRIPSKEVKWGHISMVEAERRLLARALLDDHANTRFVLLSESHVPLFDFPTVYSYLVNSTKVFLESYDEPGATGRGRYRRHGMMPVVAADQWRKGSQWFELDRALAADVVTDRVYFPVFKRACKHNCYADEHYMPTLLHIRRPAAVANRTLTWVDWSRGGPHPARFTRMEVTVDFLRWLREGTVCEYNGRTTTVCFLFARKFLPNSLTRFLRFAPKVMGFG